MSHKCWAEVNKDGRAIRIFRNKRAAARRQYADNAALVCELVRAQATDDIRRAVHARDEESCVHCGKALLYGQMELHERQSRGTILETEAGDYEGGEVSIENSETRCKDCHTVNKDSAHGNRQPQFSTPSGRFSCAAPNEANKPKGIR